MVGLCLTYSNLNPQLDDLLERLSGPLPARTENPGSSHAAALETSGVIGSNYGKPPRFLNQRLSREARSAAAAFASGARQKELAREYGISIRSVKRLIQQSRTAGAI